MSNPLDRIHSNLPASVAARTTAAARVQEIAAGAGSEIERALQSVGARSPVARAGTMIVQRIEGGAVDASAQNVFVAGQLEPLYFELVVLPEEEAAGGEARVAELEPGRSYRVRIRSRVNPVSGMEAEYSTAEVKVPRVARFHLEADQPAAGEAAEPDGTLVDYPAEAPDEWAYDFSLRLPRGYADPHLVLRLMHREDDLREPRVATRRRLAVKGAAPGAGVPQAPAHFLVAGFVPPPRTAVLYLTASGPDQFVARGFLRDAPNRPRVEPIERPPLPAGEFTSVADFVREVDDAVQDFATGDTGGIGPWLEEVIRLYGEECCLMIADDTELGTPWELFRLQDGSRLGARAQVVRWVNTVYRDKPLAWDTEPVTVPGRGAAYIHPDDSGSPLGKSSALDAGWERYSDPDQLEVGLLTAMQDGEPVGVVYLALSRCLAYDAGEEKALAGLYSPASGPVRFRLRDVAAAPGFAPRPLIFANTPFAARVPRHGSGTIGLVRAMLSQVASGFIGPLGPVEPELAAAFAEKVLSAASEGEVRPARLLQRLRQEALKIEKDFLRPRRERDAALLAFFYVYYGNPQVVICPVEDDDG